MPSAPDIFASVSRVSCLELVTLPLRLEVQSIVGCVAEGCGKAMYCIGPAPHSAPTPYVFEIDVVFNFSLSLLPKALSSPRHLPSWTHRSFSLKLLTTMSSGSSCRQLASRLIASKDVVVESGVLNVRRATAAAHASSSSSRQPPRRSLHQSRSRPCPVTLTAYAQGHRARIHSSSAGESAGNARRTTQADHTMSHRSSLC